MPKLSRSLAVVLLALTLGAGASPVTPAGVLAGPGNTICC